MKNLMKTVVLSLLVLLPILGVAKHNDDPKNKVIIHIYRPNKVVGWGWVFKLKANGNKIAKIKNGKHVTLEIDPGETNFQMNKNNIQMNLKAGEVYFFRASLTRNLLIGKPELVEVTKEFAETEIREVIK